MKETREGQITYVLFVITVLTFLYFIASTLPRNVIIYVDTADWGLKGCIYVIAACLLYMCYEKYPQVKGRIMGRVAPHYFSLMKENEDRRFETKENKHRLDKIEPVVEDNATTIHKIQELDDNSGNQRK